MEVELMKVCLIKGCKSNESTSFLFGFPIEDPHQLNEWIEQIPFLDLSSVDLKNSFLCENHFDTEQIRIISDKQLLPNAIPSIFPSPDEDAAEPDPLACRFCLKTFDCSKSSIFIDSIIRRHFKILTNSEVSVFFSYAIGNVHVLRNIRNWRKAVSIYRSFKYWERQDDENSKEKVSRKVPKKNPGKFEGPNLENFGKNWANVS